MKEQILQNFEENLKNYFEDLTDLTNFNLIGVITKYEIFDNKLAYLNDELEQNLKEGADVNCLVIENKLENEGEISNGNDLQLNNFLNLSLKNSLIKGLTQKVIDPYHKRNENSIEESFETRIILGVNFLINNFKIFNDENLVMENYLNNTNFIGNNLNYETLPSKNSYHKFLPYKNNSISGFNYEKIRKMQNYDWCDEYIKKAQYMMEKNSYEKALDYLKEAEKLDELNHEIYEKKGICYYSKNEFDMAKKEFKKALSKEDSAIAKSYLITLSEIEEKDDKKNQGKKSNYSHSVSEKKETALLNKKRYNK